MAQNVYIGLLVSSENASAVATATFDSISVNSDLFVAPVITGVSGTTGPVSTQVTISGTGFGTTQGSSFVALNGLPTTINSWAFNSISITVPAGATSGPLEVVLGPTINSSNPVDFTVTTQPLPTGWLDQDIGPVGLAGSATYSGGTFTVNGAGNGLTSGSTVDGFHFVYTTLNGDGQIIARLDSVSSASQVGLMIRESMNSGSTMVANLFCPACDNYYVIAERTSTGAALSEQYGMYQAAIPYWLKLNRTGNTFSGYVSPDGVNWTQVASSQTVSMAQGVYVGFAVSSGSTASLATVTFDTETISLGTMPTIASVSPSSGGHGASVTVVGSNFGSSQGTSAITFNGTPATSISSWTSSQIIATVPQNATTGPVVVSVSSIGSNTNFSYTVYNPVLTSISPPVGQGGATITLSGSGLGPYQGTSKVFFNGVDAGGSGSWSDTSITIGVPLDAVSGPVTVIEGGVTSNSVSFSVENLSVTGISPATGPLGSTVTITGTGFGPTQSNSTVDFFGTTANIQSWSDTQIVAVVAAGTVTGPVDVTVGSIEWYGPIFRVNATVGLADSLGNQTSYTSTMVGGKWRTQSSQGSGCSTCTVRGNIAYTYDLKGDILTRTDENGNVTTYTYDLNSNVISISYPGNLGTATYSYNGFNEVLTATDPMGFTTTNTYDNNGNLLSVTSPAPGNGAAASVTQFAYNSLGELTKITDPLGNVTNLTYTAAGLIQTIADAQSNVTTYAYDSRGNRTSVTDANSKQTTFTYDSMNRLTEITYPDSTTTQFGYDYRGRRTSVTDQNGKATAYAYDDADRLTTVTDAANNVTTYGYDTESNLTSIQDANHNTTNFSYDAFGRVIKTTFPSGYVETYGYDNVGNLTGKTDRKNQLITYTYDQLNRLTQKTYPDTSTVNYTYDNDSRLTQVTDPTGTYQFTFDNMGRLAGTSTQYAFLTSRTFTTSYVYDAASNRTGFTDPEGGASSYAYDTLNRLQTLTPPAAISGGNFGFAYDVLSRRTSLTRPNSVNTSYSYDNLSHLLSVTHAKGGATLDGASYTLDNAGNRTAKSDLFAGVTTNYGYDAIYELLNATQSGTTKESYTYDPVGNRLTDLGSTSWSYNTANELTSRPSNTYTYDQDGNTTTVVNSSGTTTYAWDFENRLTSVILPGSGGTVSFKYDPFGRRIYKSSSNGTGIFAYDYGNVIEETNSAGGAVARYAQSLSVDQPLAMLRSSTTSYYEEDGLGSVTSLTDITGALAQTYTYDSFGNTATSTGTLRNNFQYTAREFDSETNLYFYRARYYDPSAGRFISGDPIGFNGGVNFYAYVYNAALSFVDPTGTYAKLNANSRCAKIFAKAFGPGLCVEDFVSAFNESASKLPIFTVRSPKSPASNLTEDAVSGNGNQSTLGSFFFETLNPPTAYTITSGRPAIVLGPDYFNEPLDQRIADLLHEEVHALTLFDDAAIFDLFNQYGLPDTEFRNWPHPTSEFSDWIRKGCPPKP
jgi:RHS repeat-associated protein